MEWEVRPLNREQWLSLARSPYLAFKGDSQTTASLIQAQFLSGSHEISLENGLHIATRESPSSRLTSILRSIRSSRVHKGVKNLDDWSEIIGSDWCSGAGHASRARLNRISAVPKV